MMEFLNEKDKAGQFYTKPEEKIYLPHRFRLESEWPKLLLE